MRIGIIGNGVVGNATAEAFRPAHEVRCYDRVPERCTHNVYQVVSCDLVFVCLPTPQLGNYLRCDTEWVEGFFSEMVDRNKHDWDDGRTANYVLRSTVPIGFTRKMKEKYNLPNLAHSPEFLTARTAVEDAKNPTRLIVGGHNACAGVLLNLYRNTWPGVSIFRCTSDESEYVKLLQNVMSAIKIAALNEARALADRYNLDWELLLRMLLAGGWINPMHTQVPGPDGKRGFGGTCLPKDLANWITCLRDAGLEDNVSFAAHTRNQKDRS